MEKASVISGPPSTPLLADGAVMPGGAPTAEEAHEAYTRVINSNDVDALMEMLTDDIIYQTPNEPEISGSEAVRAWVKAYFDAYETHWDKPVTELVVNGDWAFERYNYTVTDTSRKDGSVSKDEGKAMLIYRKGADGRWRVARDGWSSNLPLR